MDQPVTYEVQARRLVRRHGVVIRDDVDRVRTDRLTDARRTAQTFTEAGFTAWIFRVEPGPTTSAVYRTVEIQRPAARCS